MKAIQNGRRGLTLIEFLVAVAIITVMLALFLPATHNPPRAGRRTLCKNSLKQIGLALHNYHDTYGSFPPAYTVDADGARLHSWRTLLLPFLDQEILYETIDLTKPWNDPANQEAFDTILAVYQCPSAFLDSPVTTYLALTGEEFAFDGASSRMLSDFSDGTSKTVMILEVETAKAVHWMSPEDISGSYLAELNENMDLSHAPGTHALFVDGSVRWLGVDTTVKTREALATIAGSEKITEEY